MLIEKYEQDLVGHDVNMELGLSNLLTQSTSSHG
jgi:hypothetical protein